jgi:hypothetical protein
MPFEPSLKNAVSTHVETAFLRTVIASYLRPPKAAAGVLEN